MTRMRQMWEGFGESKWRGRIVGISLVVLFLGGLAGVTKLAIVLFFDDYGATWAILAMMVMVFAYLYFVSWLLRRRRRGG